MIEKRYNHYTKHITIAKKWGEGSMKLGKMQEVDIRKVWAHEQYDFSK